MLVSEVDGVSRFGAETAHKDSGVDFFVESCVDLIPVAEFVDLVALVGQRHRVQSSMG